MKRSQQEKERFSIRRYVIIGSGAAGIAALESIRVADATAEIVLLSEERHGYYSRPGLAYYLTGELNESQLFPFSAQDFKQLGVYPQQARVVRILPDQHVVELQNGGHLRYDRLLIATGATAAKVDIPGASLEGVVKLDNLDDARQILSRARRRQVAVVVGGGITALEIVEGLVAKGVKTHYFLRRERYWHNVLDEIESRIVEERLGEHGVHIHYNTELGEILANKNKVGGVRTIDGDIIRCNMVAIAIGIRPRITIARSSGLQIERGILVDEKLQTSAADIFAAGDVAQVYDPFTGKSVLDSLWGPARHQGSIAGKNMTGAHEDYLKPVAFNVTRLAGLTTTIVGTVGKGRDDDLIGIARGDSETWRQLPDSIVAQQDFDINRLRLMLGENTILGAIVMGDQTLSKPLHTLVAEKIDITSLRAKLLEPDAPVADLIAEFWAFRKSVHVPQYA
ncbi:MAG: NAD(P)/FAD-dependent oxidoreductase [Anaerolineales bacterium]